MYIKLGDTLINLDLVKDVSPVIQIARFFRVADDPRYLDDYAWEMPLPDEPIEEGRSTREERIQRAEEQNRFSHWEWVFFIRYIDGHVEWVKGIDQSGVDEARDQFFVLLTDNQPTIPSIELMGGTYQHPWWNGKNTFRNEL